MKKAVHKTHFRNFAQLKKFTKISCLQKLVNLQQRSGIPWWSAKALSNQSSAEIRRLVWALATRQIHYSRVPTPLPWSFFFNYFGNCPSHDTFTNACSPFKYSKIVQISQTCTKKKKESWRVCFCVLNGSTFHAESRSKRYSSLPSQRQACSL